MLREQILQKAETYFNRIGIRGVSMDYIAGSLRISKKTVYSHFSSKLELVAECIKNDITKDKNEIARESKKAQSPLGAIVAINSTVFRQSHARCPAFHQDIKHFELLQELISRHYTVFIRREYLKYFSQGQEDGLFIPNHNIPLTLDFLEEQIHSSDKWIVLGNTRQIENYAITIFTYMAGICTDLGRKELEAFRPELFLITK